MATPVEILKSDVQNHAKTLGVLVIELRDIKDIVEQLVIDKAVKVEQDKYLDDRLRRIEASITSQTNKFDAQFKAIYRLGIWVLCAFGMALITGIGNFIIKGGLANVGGP